MHFRHFVRKKNGPTTSTKDFYFFKWPKLARFFFIKRHYCQISTLGSSGQPNNRRILKKNLLWDLLCSQLWLNLVIKDHHSSNIEKLKKTGACFGLLILNVLLGNISIHFFGWVNSFSIGNYVSNRMKLNLVQTWNTNLLRF